MGASIAPRTDALVNFTSDNPVVNSVEGNCSLEELESSNSAFYDDELLQGLHGAVEDAQVSNTDDDDDSSDAGLSDTEISCDGIAGASAKSRVDSVHRSPGPPKGNSPEDRDVLMSDPESPIHHTALNIQDLPAERAPECSDGSPKMGYMATWNPHGHAGANDDAGGTNPTNVTPVMSLFGPKKLQQVDFPNSNIATSGLFEHSVISPEHSAARQQRRFPSPDVANSVAVGDIRDSTIPDSNATASIPDAGALPITFDCDPESLFLHPNEGCSGSHSSVVSSLQETQTGCSGLQRSDDEHNMSEALSACTPSSLSSTAGRKPNLVQQRIKDAQAKARMNSSSGSGMHSAFSATSSGAVDRSLEEYRREHKALVDKKTRLQETAGELDAFEYEIELQKIENQINDSDRRRQMNESYLSTSQSAYESLEDITSCNNGPGRKRRFEGGEYDDLSDNDDNDNDNGLQSDNEQTTSSVPKLPSKARKTKAAAKDLQQSEDVQFEERPKKKRKSGKGQSKSDCGGISKAPKKASRKTTGKGAEKKSKNKQKTMLDFNSLTTANLIRDAQGNNEAGAAPTFTATTRHQAYKQLVASVAVEHYGTAEMDKTFLARATKEFTGHSHACKPDGQGGWLIRGMKSSLTNFQVLGSSFMRKRETGSDEPRGGILADHMGLGKTVQALAVIMNGNFTRGDGPRTTLIVAPSSLCLQWFSEILLHCQQKAYGKVLKWFAGHRLDSNDVPGAIAGYDIVITTYTEILRSYPFEETPLWCQTAEQKDLWWKDWFEKEKGPFHRIRFLRIILDEAQAIKTYTSKTSISCRSLRAVHKWAISATPIMNKCTELYPYFKFLRVPNTGTFEIFKENYTGDPSKLRRLHAQLNKFMVRRTHKDQLFGAPLVQLPTATEHITWLKFNQIEKRVYDIVSNRIQERIRDFRRTGTLEQNYTNMLTWLLRLRQLTCHILLLEVVCKDLLEPQDYVQLIDLAKEEAHARQQDGQGLLLVQLRKLLASQAANSSRKNIARVDTNQVEAALSHIDLNETGKDHGLTYKFKEYLDSLKRGQNWAEVNRRTICPFCGNLPENPVLSNCLHIHCKDCVEQMQQIAALRDMEAARCGQCTEPFHELKDLAASYNEAAASTAAEFADGGKGKKGKGKGKGKRNNKDNSTDGGLDPDEAALISQINLNEVVLPSPKTLAVKAQLLNWFAEDPKTKVIVYTQFNPMIHILAKVCAQEGWDSVKFYGGMSMHARDIAIRKFAGPDCRVFIASLKCGGLGLNLTMASKVICIDPWWNESVDQQAFGRVFRIGQKNETHFTRLFISNTVDDHMYKMQERKQAEIDGVMDRNGKSKMSVKELAALFEPRSGETADEDTGFIMVEDPDESYVPCPPSNSNEQLGTGDLL